VVPGLMQTRRVHTRRHLMCALFGSGHWSSVEICLISSTTRHPAKFFKSDIALNA